MNEYYHEVNDRFLFTYLGLLTSLHTQSTNTNKKLVQMLLIMPIFLEFKLFFFSFLFVS